MVGTTTHRIVYVGVLPRGGAYLIDCAICFGLFAATQYLIFGPLAGAVGIGDDWFRSGIHTQIYTLLTVSLPVWLYFALFEQSALQATPGKRLFGLKTARELTNDRVRFSRSMLRTAIKLLPWELAHVTNNLPEPMWYESRPAFRFGFAAVGILIALYVAIVALHPKNQGPHDIIAGTLVLRRK